MISHDITMTEASVGTDPLHLPYAGSLFALQWSEVSTFIQHPADVEAHQTAIVF